MLISIGSEPLEESQKSPKKFVSLESYSVAAGPHLPSVETSGCSIIKSSSHVYVFPRVFFTVIETLSVPAKLNTFGFDLPLSGITPFPGRSTAETAPPEDSHS